MTIDADFTFNYNEKEQVMKKTHIPMYTINQKVYLILFEEFSVVRGIIAKRLCDKDDEYMYTFKNDKFQVEYEEENIFLTFQAAKNYMEEVVKETLADVQKLTTRDVREI